MGYTKYRFSSQHYLSVKNFSALLRALTSKHYGGFCSLNCLHSFSTENKRESHKRLREYKIFRNVAIPSKNTKILVFNQYQKSIPKIPFIVYADLECLIKKLDRYKNNPKNSFTTEVSEHISSPFFNVCNIFI